MGRAQAVRGDRERGPARRGLRRHPLGGADVPRSHRVRRVVRAGRPAARAVHRATRPLRRAADLDGAEAERDPRHAAGHCPRTTARRSWSGSATFRNETRERIVQAAEGNPLFVEQLVAMQAESGTTSSRCRRRLQALLAARIDRLGRAGARRCRARIGRGTAVPSRRRGRARARARARRGRRAPAVARPQGADPAGPGDVPGDDAFRFGHILIRDAAYDAIPKRQRAALHERYADWLEARLGDDAPTRSSATTSSRRTATESSSASSTRPSEDGRRRGSEPPRRQPWPGRTLPRR